MVEMLAGAKSRAATEEQMEYKGFRTKVQLPGT
jgi:hypothetical protein